MDESVQRRGHHELSVFGLLADHSAKGLTNLVHQCVDLGLLERTPGDRPVVRLTEEGMAAMKGRLEVQFTRPPEGTSTRRTKADTADWEGVDRSLFERLREWRKTVAASEGVPPYVVFGDRTLRALAKVKPTELGALLEVPGIGAAKSQKYGESVLAVLNGDSAPVAED
jgi:ATP-dependent DNA helicase RecQ